MGAAGFGGSYAPIVQYEKREIHSVFPQFPYFRSGQNLSPNLLVPLCGVALTLIQQAKAKNKNKRIDKRLTVFEISAQGIDRAEIAHVTGYHIDYIPKNTIMSITGREWILRYFN